MGPMLSPPDAAEVELVPPPPRSTAALATLAAEAAEHAELAAEAGASLQSASQPIASRPVRSPASPLGLAGLCLVCLAGPCLSFPELRWTAMGLAAGSLVLALASRYVKVPERDRPAILPLVVSGLAVPTVVISGLFPGLLSITPPSRGPAPVRDMTALYMVPIRGVGLQPASEWVQADQFTLQRGELRAHVLGGVVQLDQAMRGNGSEPHVYLSLRLSNVGGSRPVALARLASEKGPAAPILRHDHGDAFPWVVPSPGTAALPRDRLSPQESLDFVLTFQGNPREEDLLLELPALDGGAGSFRFRVPPTMIRR
jgi:hypothetical protein